MAELTSLTKLGWRAFSYFTGEKKKDNPDNKEQGARCKKEGDEDCHESLDLRESLPSLLNLGLNVS